MTRDKAYLRKRSEIIRKFILKMNRSHLTINERINQRNSIPIISHFFLELMIITKNKEEKHIIDLLTRLIK